MKKSGIILEVETPALARWLSTIKTEIIPNGGFCILFGISSSMIVS